MKCELVQSWYVYDFDEPKECLAIYNEKGEATHLSWDTDDEELIKTYGRTHVFKTFDEAKAYHNSIQPTFNKKQVHDYICWLQNNGEEDKLKELLPSSIINNLKNRDNNIPYYMFSRIVSDTAKGVICIDANTVRIDQVSHIRHGEDCVELVLANGAKIKTRTYIETLTVKAIFSDNNSGRTYTSLTADKD